MNSSEEVAAPGGQPTPLSPEDWHAHIDKLMRDEAIAQHGHFNDWSWEAVAHLIEELEAGMERDEAAHGQPPSYEASGGAAIAFRIARVFVEQGDYPWAVPDVLAQIGALATFALDRMLIRSDGWPGGMEEFDEMGLPAQRPHALALLAIEQAAANIAAPESQPTA